MELAEAGQGDAQGDEGHADGQAGPHPHALHCGHPVHGGLQEECRSRNIRLLFSHLNPQPLSVLEKSGLYAEIGPESFLPNIDEALALAQEL